MLHLDKSLARLAANPLGWRVGDHQPRMCCFQRFKFLQQAIEFGVTDFRMVEHVVAVLVVTDFLAQFFGRALQISCRHRHELII